MILPELSVTKKIVLVTGIIFMVSFVAYGDFFGCRCDGKNKSGVFIGELRHVEVRDACTCWFECVTIIKLRDKEEIWFQNPVHFVETLSKNMTYAFFYESRTFQYGTCPKYIGDPNCYWAIILVCICDWEGNIVWHL